MNDDEFMFDGINSKDMGLIVKHINKPIAPEITNNRQPIPAMYGDLNQGNTFGAKTFTIDVQFLAETNEDYNDAVRNLAAYLMRPDGGSGEYEMIFGDDPGITYYGIFTQIPEATQLQETVNDSAFTLLFVASDPQGYGPQVTIPVDTEPFEFSPDGTGKVFPVYTIVPQKDVYELGIALGGEEDNDGYVAVGYTIDADEATAVADKNPTLVKDPCNTLATWTKQTATPSWLKGVVDTNGDVQSNTNSISIKETDSKGSDFKYGDVMAHTSEWFGQLLVHESLPTDVSDFDLKFRIHHTKKYGRAMSKSEVYLLDKNANVVGLVNVADASKGAMSTFTLKLGKGLKKVISDKIHFGKQTNGANTPTKIVVTSKKTTTKITGKGKKAKKKTVVTYPTHTDYLTNYHNSDYFNNAFVQVSIHKVGLKMQIDVVECDPKTGAEKSTKVINNRQYSLTAEQDFALNTIAWYGAMYSVTEDYKNVQTSKPNKSYNHGFNSITGYRVNQVLDDTNTDPQVIAKAGSTIVIDCQDWSVTVSDSGGTSSLKSLTSLGSSFPPVQGGQTTGIAFSPSVLEADINIQYRPAFL